jgi:L-aspartate oxidase
MTQRRRIIIVGSGIAGLIAALRLSQQFDVSLVTKSELGESNTRWAQGGIAAAMFPDDSAAEHAADTMRAGAGLCNREAVDVLCSEGPKRIRDLIQMGVAFDERNGGLARGLEAAHSRPRVLHAQGDATGLSIETALVRAVRAANISVLEHTFACDLLCDSDRTAGLKVLDENGAVRELEADAVILASGGAGHLFQHTTNPTGATGDGTALALRAGAQLADLEFRGRARRRCVAVGRAWPAIHAEHSS